MAVHRFFILIFALIFVGLGLFWIFRYFFGGKSLEVKLKAKKKMIDDELEALQKVKRSYNQKTKK